MSENHIRAISSTLSLVDESVCEFEQWANGQEIRSVLYEVRNDLDMEQQQKISAAVSAMRSVLRELRDALKLEAKSRTVDNMIRGTCSVLWVYLAEIEGKHLRKYGEPPPGLAEFLDPRLGMLTQQLRNVSKIAEGPRLDY